jgi:spore germination protein KA
MFGIYNKMKKIFKPRKSPQNSQSIKDVKRNEPNPLSSNLEENMKHVKAIFDRCSDIIMRDFKISAKEPIRAFIVYMDGMIDKDLTSNNILQALQLNPSLIRQGQKISKSNASKLVKDQVLSTTEVNVTSDMLKMVDFVLAGDVALIIDGTPEAIISSVRQWETRSVDEPQTEPLVRGPRDGFVENLPTNATLIRRRIRTSRLKMEVFKLGHLTKTNIAIFYIDGIAGENVIKEVRQRISRIKIDGILASGYVEEFIEDHPFSIFPQVNTTERPDRMCACLLEGRVGIVVDNTPMCLIVPATFPQFLQSPEDYYNRYPYATFTRLLRFITLNIALLLPSVYIAVLTFHQEMLPTPLLISIAGQREGVPFPAFMEALLMEMVFEFLREAGIRLPRPVGQAVSIVGALVIGQAAVSAGLVSSAMVMVVSLTAIASFTIPTISGSYAIRLLRFPIMFLAASFGLFGIMVGLMAILLHICSMRSFGVPYISPHAPMSFSDLKDSVIRVPWWAMITRPTFVGVNEPQRQELGQKPGPYLDHEKTPHNNKQKGGGSHA